MFRFFKKKVKNLIKHIEHNMETCSINSEEYLSNCVDDTQPTTINFTDIKSIINYFQKETLYNYLLVIGCHQDVTADELTVIGQLFENLERKRVLTICYLKERQWGFKENISLLLTKRYSEEGFQIATQIAECSPNLSILSRDENDILIRLFSDASLSSCAHIICPSFLNSRIDSQHEEYLWVSTYNNEEYQLLREDTTNKILLTIDRMTENLSTPEQDIYRIKIEELKEKKVKDFNFATSFSQIREYNESYLNHLLSFTIWHRVKNIKKAEETAINNLEEEIEEILCVTSIKEKYEYTKKTDVEHVLYHIDQPQLTSRTLDSYCPQPFGHGKIQTKTAKVKRATFAPNHLSKHEDTMHRNETLKSVYSAVLAPLESKRGKTMMVQIFLYEMSEADNVMKKALTVDKKAEVRNYTPLYVPLKIGDVINVELSFTDKSLVIDEPIQELYWRGRFTSAEFCIEIPLDYYRSTLVGTVFMMVEGLPIGKMKFVTSLVNSPTPLYANVTTSPFRKIFMSYSHKDSKRVASMAEGFKLAGNIDYFFDRHTLKPGDNFEKLIHNFIDSSDAFVLFWSKNSAKSEWVTREYTWAIERRRTQGEDELAMHPLHIAPFAEIPEALCNLHFSMLE